MKNPKNKKIETVSIEEIEVINTSSEPEKITKIRVDDKNSSHQNPMEELLKKIKEKNGSIGENHPIFKIMGNIDEIKKVKPYFIFSIIFGIWSLFGLRDVMGFLAIFFGIMDITIGSILTRKASYIGIIFGLIGLILYFK